MIIARPLTMTVVCKDCGNQYGRWRSHCPTCGTATPVTKREDPPVVKRMKERRLRQEVLGRCTVCRRGKNLELKCPHCAEAIHPMCLRLHAEGCRHFQAEREAILKGGAA